jgi:hypothetical protein
MNRNKARAILVLGFLLLGFSIWGQTASVPYTFSAGSPARAADVNADFNTLVKALPGISVTNFMLPQTAIPAGTIATNISTIKMSAPSNGYVLVTLEGNGTTSSGVNLGISDISAPDMSSHPIDYASLANTTTVNTFYVSSFFPVSAGSNTFWAVAQGLSARASDVVCFCRMFVQFYPNTY